MRSKHSDLADTTNRSANAFKFGLRAGRTQWLHAAVPQQAPKGGGVERISVENEVLHAAEEAVAGVGQVPCDLRHPRFVRLTRDPGDLHRAGLELHDEEDDVADQAAARSAPRR